MRRITSTTWAASVSLIAWHLEPNDLQFPLLVRIVDEQMQATPLQGVAQVAGIVAGMTTT